MTSCNNTNLYMINRELDYFEKKADQRDNRRMSYLEQQSIINRMSPIDHSLCNFKGKEDLVVDQDSIPEEIREESENINFVDEALPEEVLYNSDLMIKNFDY